MSNIYNYKEWLFLREWQKMQEKALEQSFRDGSYWRTSGSESERQWIKLRNKKYDN